MSVSEPKKRRRKKGRFFRKLIVLVIFAAVAALLLGTPPVRNPENALRRSGKCNILLAGTDADGTRTDTIMLLSLDQTGGTLRLLSIPRDTYAAGYGASKLNSVYSAGGTGASGMELLMDQVAGVIGFAPDAYVLVDLDCFVEAVDLLGGVDFDVPMDMHYDDPAQGLAIHLSAGYQHLDGEQAMELVRFRSGYANADIGRTEVQRAFMKAALRQWLRPSNLAALPSLWRLYWDNMVTDLTPRNLLWIARMLIKADLEEMQTDVLPGWADMVGGSSVYFIDPFAAEDVLRPYDPYQ